MIMLVHDAVTVAVAGAHPKMVPFGPPQKFEEVFADPDAQIIVCNPCAEVRGITEDMLIANCTIGGMNDFHEHVSRPDCKAVSF